MPDQLPAAEFDVDTYPQVFYAPSYVTIDGVNYVHYVAEEGTSFMNLPAEVEFPLELALTGNTALDALSPSWYEPPLP